MIRLNKTLIQAALAILLMVAPGIARAASCDGDVRCIAREAVATPCGGVDPEAVTALAMLGLLPDAIQAVTSGSCPGNAWLQHGTAMNRAKIFGRLAVAEKLSGVKVETELLNRAQQVADEAHALAKQAMPSQPYDYAFADVVCDLAQDHILIGESDAARRLITEAHETPPYFESLCLGRLAGVLNRLSRAYEAGAMMDQALAAAVASPPANYQAYARAGLADGLYDGQHIDEILHAIDSINRDGFQSVREWQSFRLTVYRSIDHQEVANRHWDHAWQIEQVEWNEGRMEPFHSLGELLFAMAEYGMQGSARTVFAGIQQELAMRQDERILYPVLPALGSVFLVLGDPTSAEKQFAAVQRDAAAVPQSRDPFRQDLIRAYAAAGDFARATDLVEQYFPKATDAQASMRRSGVMQDIAIAAVKAGKPDVAFRIAEGTDGPMLPYMVIHEIVQVSADNGDFGGAEQWARKMPPGMLQGSLLAYIAARAACASSGDAQWVILFRSQPDLARFPDFVPSVDTPALCQTTSGHR